jgi:hypothetical protein
MREEFKEIGENAGKVWRYLNDKRIEIAIQDLSKKIDLGVIEIAMAVGWLAKEKNITIERKGYLFYVSHEGF